MKGDSDYTKHHHREQGYRNTFGLPRLRQEHHRYRAKSYKKASQQ